MEKTENKKNSKQAKSSNKAKPNKTNKKIEPKQKAFTHFFAKEGINEEDFITASENVKALKLDYEFVGVESNNKQGDRINEQKECLGDPYRNNKI